MDRREKGNMDLLHNHKGAPLLQCQYCGMTELQIGSPLVIGQNRSEFEAYMEMFGRPPRINNIFENKKDTVVKFSILKNEVVVPRVEVPHFPVYGSPEAASLAEVLDNMKHSNNIHLLHNEDHCPIVHELCALNMFRNRARRER